MSQDAVFTNAVSHKASFNLYHDFVGLLTGTTPTTAQLGRIEEKQCPDLEHGGQGYAVPYAKGYVISCLSTYRANINAALVTYSIFKQPGRL